MNHLNIKKLSFLQANISNTWTMESAPPVARTGMVGWSCIVKTPSSYFFLWLPLTSCNGSGFSSESAEVPNFLRSQTLRLPSWPPETSYKPVLYIWLERLLSRRGHLKSSWLPSRPSNRTQGQFHSHDRCIQATWMGGLQSHWSASLRQPKHWPGCRSWCQRRRCVQCRKQPQINSTGWLAKSCRWRYPPPRSCSQRWIKSVIWSCLIHCCYFHSR